MEIYFGEIQDESKDDDTNEVNTIKRFDVSNYTRVGRIPFNYLAFSRFRGHDSWITDELSTVARIQEGAIDTGATRRRK